MFDYNNMLKRAITFFPKWTDIRKRYDKSLGGQFLNSVMQEEATIKESIDEYIKSYFLITYSGNEDEVMAFAYRIQIGQLDNLKNIEVFYKRSLFPFVSTAKDFESITTYSFYEDGYIYIKEEDYDPEEEELEVVIGQDSAFYKLERVHIWNIFDEFATFVNLRRHQWETNSELVKRILYTTANLPNSTEDGLKHAIISELLTEFPEISMDDINISPTTPENLIKPYEDYETLLDMLAEVNRDIYRCKRWDTDFWTYDFESISYIPHVWDKAITEWKNGIGSGDDLKVIIADEVETTDASITLYTKSLEAFQLYLRDKYIKTDINFSLIKYNDSLKSSNVKYIITASELQDITDEDISLKLYESNSKEIEIPIADVVSGWGKDFIRKENNIISKTDNFEYMIQFDSKNNEEIKISSAEVIYDDGKNHDMNDELGDHELLDLKIAKDGFIVNSENELVYNSNNKTINSIENFTSSTGFINVQDGIKVEDVFSEGIGTISVDLSSEEDTYLNYDITCNKSSINKNMINFAGGYWNADNEFVIRGDYSAEEKIFSFDIDANYIEFYFDSGVSSSINKIKMIDHTDSKEYESSIESGRWFYSNKTAYIKEYVNNTRDTDNVEITRTVFNEPMNPHKLTIEISVLCLDDVKISNFNYKNYTFDISSNNGELSLQENGLLKINSMFTNTTLTFRLASALGDSPVIHNISIGNNFNNSYSTIKIPYKTDCDRIINIKTNAHVTLFKIKSDGTLEKDMTFNHIPEFEGTSDNAEIKIDLSNYDNITSVLSNGGFVETIVDNGAIFYYLKLKKGDKASYVTIKGQLTNEAREITLKELIKYQIPDYDSINDKIYCSMLSDGLVVSRKNPGGDPYNVFVQLTSKAINGINAYKYILKTPGHIGVIFGSNNGDKIRSNTTSNDFDYISLYPAMAEIYKAINECNVVQKDTRNISIVNNFAPVLNTNKYLFYTIELFDKTINNTIVKFHNELTKDAPIEELPNWSIGTSNSMVAIENKVIDIYNVASYDSNDMIISVEEELSDTIDIKDSYSLTDSTVLNVEHHILKIDDDRVEILYQEYNGKSETEHLLKHETININNSGFNKLVCSNIDRIYHLSSVPYTTHYIIEDIPHILIKDAGIIAWNDKVNYDYLYIVYSIKKPIAFKFDEDYLYEKIEYDTLAYSKLDTIIKQEIEDGEKINIKNEINNLYLSNKIDYSFDDVDLIYAECSEPTFESIIDKDSVITFNKFIEEDTVLIKTGYYYINGREYYLFSNNDNHKLSNTKFYELSNADLSEGEFRTYKETNNYLYNSEMRLKSLSETFNLNTINSPVKGVSLLKTITACDSFNEWKCFGMKMKLEKGLNDLGIQFTSEVVNGYCYLDITDYLEDGANYLSFYSSQGLTTYIGVEKDYLNVKFNRALNIKLEEEIISIDEQDNIRNTVIYKVDNKIRYYLVLKGNGIIDDIILSTNQQLSNSHIKNINKLGLNFEDKRVQGDIIRLSLNNNKDYTPYKAGLMSDGYIKNTSSIDWHTTNIMTLDIDNDFRNCVLNNVGVNSNYIYTDVLTGYVETPIINLNNPKTVKNLIVKINDIDFPNMQGFTCEILSANEPDGQFVSKQMLYSNIGSISGDNLFKYVKLRINMPANKIINSIALFAEYRSTTENPLPVGFNQSGSIESKIYDLQQVIDSKIKNIKIEEISKVDDIFIYIRASQDTDRIDIWTDWKQVVFDDKGMILNNIVLKNSRFVQYKIVLKTRDAYIKFKNIELEVM